MKKRDCIKCHESKDQAEFPKTGNRCKPCINKYNRERLADPVLRERQRAANRRSGLINRALYSMTRRKNRHLYAKPSPTKKSYYNMLSRCNPNYKNRPMAHRYTERGISICDRWLGPNGFTNFLADMGERPSDKTLDRINPNGNYEPGNCRWATKSQQSANATRISPTTGFRGVCLHGGRYIARIARNGTMINLGSFTDIIKAAEAYDFASLLAHGDFAQLNFLKSKDAFYEYQS